MWLELLQASGETLYMSIVSCAIASLLGIPLGLLLFCSRSSLLWSAPMLYHLLSFLINILRSVPFIILMIAVMPLTYLIIGTAIGIQATIVPLSIAAAPFIARLVETALQRLDHGVIEAGLSMGMSRIQMIYRILIPEALSGIISAIGLALITLVGYSAMAGVIGGGGLGALAINYGYQRFDTRIMIETIVLLVVIVQGIQWGLNVLLRRLEQR